MCRGQSMPPERKLFCVMDKVCHLKENYLIIRNKGMVPEGKLFCVRARGIEPESKLFCVRDRGSRVADRKLFCVKDKVCHLKENYFV